MYSIDFYIKTDPGNKIKPMRVQADKWIPVNRVGDTPRAGCRVSPSRHMDGFSVSGS
jgi:hypothetical protein